MTTLTTHVLDVARGVPAAGLDVRLARIDGAERIVLATVRTNADGRTDTPLGTDLPSGTYELVFAAGPYFAGSGTPSFYGEIPVRIVLDAARPHHHVPLLLSPYGYTTYRGS